MTRKIIFILSIAFFYQAALFAGGGWPTGKAKGYIKLSQWWVISDKHYTDIGLVDPNITRGIFNTAFYAEYGLSDRWTAIGYVPVFARATVNNEVSGTTGEILIPGDAINGVGDIDLGIKYSFNTNKSIALSTSLFLGLPIGEDSGGANGTLQLGDGEFNQMLRFDAGTGFSLGKVSGYANVFAAYNNRTKGFSDEIRWGAEAGINLLQNRLGLTLRVTSIESTNNGDSNIGTNSTSIFANNSEFLSIAPEVRFNFTEKWGISASYATASSGRLIFASPSYSVGVYHSW